MPKEFNHRSDEQRTLDEDIAKSIKEIMDDAGKGDEKTAFDQAVKQQAVYNLGMLDIMKYLLAIAADERNNSIDARLAAIQLFIQIGHHHH